MDGLRRSGKIAGDWFCPQCFLQNTAQANRCLGCSAEKEEWCVVRSTLKDSYKHDNKAEAKQQKLLSQIEMCQKKTEEPICNLSHYCEWDWFYCDGLICKDPTFNRKIDIMADLVADEILEKVRVKPVVTYDKEWELTTEIGLAELGLWSNPFLNDELGLSNSAASPRSKRLKKKEVGYKKMGELMERAVTLSQSMQKESEPSEPKKPKKKPARPHRPKPLIHASFETVCAIEFEEELPFEFGDEEEEEEEETPYESKSKAQTDFDHQLALSLKWDSDQPPKLTKSTEISNPQSWPSLGPETPKPAATTTPSWPSLGNPVVSPRPVSKWGTSNLAQKLTQQKVET